jgi:formylglycine-generating enzyme required for sulfatase activity
MRGPRIRYTLVAATATVLLLAMAGSTLRAPGPPETIIEPQTRMQLVAIPPGSFTMGSPTDESGRGADEMLHRVALTRRFFMGRFEVTQADWAMVMGTAAGRPDECDRCPVVNVDFFQVSEFITRLNAQSTQMRYRLPTEAEWEYACRAGTTTPFSTGEWLAADRANYDARFPYPGDPGKAAAATRLLPVGTYGQNAFGLFDMHGNAWEWTADWYGPYPPGAQTDPAGPSAGAKRVIRGGSWRFDANSARCALRYTHAPQDKGDSLGFRIVGEPIIRTGRTDRDITR